MTPFTENQQWPPFSRAGKAKKINENKLNFQEDNLFITLFSLHNLRYKICINKKETYITLVAIEPFGDTGVSNIARNVTSLKNNKNLKTIKYFQQNSAAIEMFRLPVRRLSFFSLLVGAIFGCFLNLLVQESLQQ